MSPLANHLRLSLSPALGMIVLVSGLACAQEPHEWKMHDMNRPRPPVVTPPPGDVHSTPPSDALILFDGKDLLHWRSKDGGPATWDVREGFFETRIGTGEISTEEKFGDVQLHLEWSSPVPGRGSGQDRGNSGVFLMGLYEIQILDSYRNDTYPDGQAAAIYGQYPPLVNASRPPGEWQAYDVFFRRPLFDSSGALVRGARVTVLHNGILVQNNVEILGPTSVPQRQPYAHHPDRLPLSLQDHSHQVRFRNVWVRVLPEPD